MTARKDTHMNERTPYRGGRPRLEVSLRRLAQHTTVADNGCHIWTGAVKGDGYGSINVNGRTQQAHRIAYELHHGSIPDGMLLHHRCETSLCVNPEHLEPITRADHARLHNAFAPSREALASRTHCKHGHEFTPENTRRRSDNNGRICRTCKREEFRRRKARLRDALNHTTP